VTIDPGGPQERDVGALTDAERVRAGQIIRIRTTGGGGWGDPLERPLDEVERDLRWGKISRDGAHTDYGVVVTDDGIDAPATQQLRARRRAGRAPEPFFDRGPGYARLAGGATSNDDDWM
jgi:N-methylhydantoinase B